MKRFLFYFAALAFLSTVVFGYPVLYYSSSKVECIDVHGRERVVKNSGGEVDSYYLIYSDKTEFTIKDSWLFLTFSASSKYNKLMKDGKYKVKHAGWRVPFFSMYPNIVKIYGSCE